MTPEQARMARVALKWTLDEVAAHAGVAKNTVVALERGRILRDSSVFRIQAAFEEHGIDFILRGVQIAEKV